eukprot:Rmarinus@m.19561
MSNNFNAQNALLAAGLVGAGALGAHLIHKRSGHSESGSASTGGVKHLAGKKNPCVLGIGTHNPNTGLASTDIADMMCAAMDLKGKESERLKRIAANSQVDTRYTVFNDGKEIFWGRDSAKSSDNASLDERNARYKKEAPGIAHAAAEKAIKDWGGKKSEITHVFAVSCTGIMTPGLEFHLMQSLGLPATAQRLSILMMGCFGGNSALKAAAAFAAQDPNARVLAVCCELCSLHFQMDTRTDNLVGGSIFADGAAAFIMGQPKAGDRPLYEYLDSASYIIPDTLPLMAWNMTNTGWELGLSPQIPGQILKNVGGFVESLKKKCHANVANEDCMFPVHPGGKAIVEAIEEACGLDPEFHTWSTREVLRTRGNMSSGTVIFCLNAVRQQKTDKDYAMTISFGPGLNVEGVMMKVLDRVKRGE